MSEELRTEEEQVEAIKKWWEENGKSTVVSIVVVLAGWLGWNGYQDSVRATGEAASEVYEQLVVKATLPAQQQTDAEKAEMVALADQLASEFNGTLYSDFGQLFQAKFAIDAGDYAKAKTSLEALVAKKGEAPVHALAQVRLARVLIQLNELDQALALMQQAPIAGFDAQFAEVRGDVLFAQGKTAEARTAYQQASEAARQQGINTQLLERKINDLAEAN